MPSKVARSREPLEIVAREWNSSRAAGDAHAATIQTQRTQPIDPRTRAPDRLRIFNDSGAPMSRYNVVELTTPVVLPSDSAAGFMDGLPAIKAVVPTTPAEDIRGKVAILTEPIAAGKIGLGITSGAVRCKILLNDNGHTHAAPVAGSLLLESTPETTAPIEILWSEELSYSDEPEEVWALVRISNAHAGLRGACLSENHPGRGTAFNVLLGTWDSAIDEWVYTSGPSAKAIDWRYGVPYPESGATGLFTPRKSDAHGTIWECVSLDCSSPGEACGYSYT